MTDQEHSAINQQTILLLLVTSLVLTRLDYRSAIFDGVSGRLLD